MTCPCEKPTNGELEYHCPRLNCRMTPKFCRLYERDDYRQAWDEGRGPGQLAAVARAPRAKRELPPIGTQVVNFLTAMAALFGSGCKLTGRAEFDRRVAICVACDLFVRGRCSKCGCCGKLKALGKVWKCPEGMW